MTVESFLQHLHGVRSTSRGWMARCPAHADKGPSLSIAEGERGILVKCWAGCSVSEVCQAMGIELRQLFVNDAPLPRGSRPIPKPPRLDRRRIAFDLELHGITLQDRAESVLRAATNLDTAAWTDRDFDAAMTAVIKAQDDLARVEMFFDVADRQRAKDFIRREK